MGKPGKTLARVLRGDADANIAFRDMRTLLRALGFEERVRGSHCIFSRTGVGEILNLQARQGKCKPYQVKQVRQIILKYRLAGAFGV